MTEKGVIIDGVDVSGCKYFQIEANTIYPKAHYCGSTFYRFCEDGDNCIYKQLKRLEFENKLLKADYEASEEENKKLKNTLELIKEYALDMEVWSYIRKDLLNIIDEVLKDE